MTITKNRCNMKLANANNKFYLGDDFMGECSTCPSNDGCLKDKESCMIKNNPLNNVKKLLVL